MIVSARVATGVTSTTSANMTRSVRCVTLFTHPDTPPLTGLPSNGQSTSSHDVLTDSADLALSINDQFGNGCDGSCRI